MIPNSTADLLAAGDAMAEFLARIGAIAFVLPHDIKNAAGLIDAWHRTVLNYHTSEEGKQDAV